MKIDLQEIIRQFPAAAANRQLLLGILRDRYPTEKQSINVLLNLFDLGIPAELNKLSVLDSVQLHRLAARVENECGFNGSIAMDGVKTWAAALGVSEAVTRSAPVQEPRIPQEEPASSVPAAEPSADMGSAAPSKKKQVSSKAGIALGVVLALIFGIRAISSKPASTEKNSTPAASKTVASTPIPAAVTPIPAAVTPIPVSDGAPVFTGAPAQKIVIHEPQFVFPNEPIFPADETFEISTELKSLGLKSLKEKDHLGTATNYSKHVYKYSDTKEKIEYTYHYQDGLLCLLEASSQSNFNIFFHYGESGKLQSLEIYGHDSNANLLFELNYSSVGWSDGLLHLDSEYAHYEYYYYTNGKISVQYNNRNEVTLFLYEKTESGYKVQYYYNTGKSLYQVVFHTDDWSASNAYDASGNLLRYMRDQVTYNADGSKKS